jgi:hypothetical protein
MTTSQTSGLYGRRRSPARAARHTWACGRVTSSSGPCKETLVTYDNRAPLCPVHQQPMKAKKR